jgi:hypothetical protein
MPRGGAEVQLYCFNLSARWGWVLNALPWPLYHRERDPVPIVLINYNGSYFDVEYSTENTVYNTLKVGTG